MLVSIPENGFINGVSGQNLPEKQDRVARLPQHVGDPFRHIVVEQEPHGSGGAIWRATNKSISAM